MASTEDRLRKLISENLEVDGQPISADLDFSTSLSEIGVPSMDLVSFVGVIQEEFNVNFNPEDCDQPLKLSTLVELLDANAA